MTRHPVVSVVIPVHNRPGLLHRALSSVAEQTHPDFEVLIVDDGSTRDIADIVGSFNDARFRFLRESRRRGANAARNTGIAAAQGTWIAFLDSDDEWLPNYLARQLARLQASEDRPVSWTLCYRRDGDTTKILPLSRRLSEGEVFCQLLGNRHRAITCSAFVARKSALRGVGGFDEGLPSAQDIDIWLSLADAGHRFAAVNEPLLICHRHGQSRISGDVHGLKRGAELLHNKWRQVAIQRCGKSAFRNWSEKRLARING